MKKVWMALSSISLIIACGSPMARGADHASALAAGCHSGNPLAGTTSPARFQVLSSCTSVSGVIMTVTREADGAYQVDVALDSKFHALLSAGNTSRLHGWLLLEIEPFAAALGLRPPPIGTHVHIVGPLLLNRNHGWTEVYPVWVLEKAGGAPSSNQGGGSGSNNGGGNGSSGGGTGSGHGGGSSGSAGGAQQALFVTVVVTPKVMPRGYNHAVATAYTLPGASCTASLHYDQGANPLGALFGAVAQTAGANGTVTWSWGLDFQLSGGGTVLVTCTKDGHSSQGSTRFTIG